MAGITIPPEILRHIFSYLQFCDTLSVGQVSRQWHACSQEQLYSDLRLIQSNSSRALLLRTLLTPGLERLATYTRTLNIIWDSVEIWHILDYDFAVVEEAAARIGLSNIVRSGDEQVWLLLHLLPRLDVLTLQPVTDSPTIHTFITGMHQSADLPLALRGLRHFSLIDVVTQDQLLAMFQLPFLRTLDVIFNEIFEVPFPTAAHQTSGVTDLLLSLGWADHLSIRHSLQIPRALTRLTVTLHFIQHTGQLGLIRVALEPVRMTLQQLTMDIYDTFWYEEAPIETFYLLRAWPVLRRLCCPISWLLGRWTDAADLHLYSVLPPSLREFAVGGDRTWTHDRVVRELILLLERMGEVVPMLERLCVNRKEESGLEPELDSEFQQQLFDVCRDVGVVFAGMSDW